MLGWDGDWARFRPLLWVVRGEQSLVEVSELMQAIHEPLRETRQARLQALVKALAANAEHPDWPRLFDYLRLTLTYPASAFDLLRHLVHVPEAMILALLQSADEEFDLVWSLVEQLPFSWHLVPVTGWLLAAERYFGAVRAGLTMILTGLDYGACLGNSDNASPVISPFSSRCATGSASGFSLIDR